MPRGRGLILLDVAVLLWAVLWIFIAVRVAQEVRDVGKISDTVARVGAAVADSGKAIEDLGGLPIVGGRIEDAGRPIREAGEQARQSAEQSSESANDLSLLLGIAIALVPSLPLLGVYLPQRLAMSRDRRAIKALVRTGEQRGELAMLLAHRAVVHLPLEALHGVSEHPYEDLRAGRFEALAKAELRRLGLRPPAAPRTEPRATR